MSRVHFVFAISILIPTCARAQNGVVQINQATVAAGGNRATNGFPYIINQPGSYQLTGNLTVPAGVNGIGIAASNVTLDLNGFTITVLGANRGVYAVGSPSMISVRNGSIVAPVSGSPAVDFATLTGTNLQDLMITGFVSIEVGSNSIVRHNIATGLIMVSCPAVIVENVTTGFLTQDITSGNCVLWNNRALDLTAPVLQ
ncbi:MAG TPA: hypothetical protein VK789_07210 [Bryobacteraceae bacterium]|nr:hypothetical protein [Bryobacteraceae bacterium]